MAPKTKTARKKNKGAKARTPAKRKARASKSAMAKRVPKAKSSNGASANGSGNGSTEITTMAHLAEVLGNRSPGFTFITSLTSGPDNRFPSIMDPAGRGNPRDRLRLISAEQSNAIAHGFIYTQNRTLYDLYDEMMHKDVTLSRTLRLATSHILRRDQSFISADPDDERSNEIAIWVERVLSECRSNFGWCSFLETALLAAMQHGFSATEIVLDEERFNATGEVVPKAFMHRHPGQFGFDDLGELFLLDDSLSVKEATPVEYGTFALLRMPALYGNPYGLSLLDDLAIMYWFKKEVMKSLLYFTETYGTPLIIIKPGETFTDEKGDASEYFADLRVMIENLSREHGLVLAKGEDITIEDRSGGMKGDLHQNVIRWITQEQVKYFMGSLLASEESEFGTRAHATVHGNTTNIRLAGVTDLVSEMVTRDIVTPLVLWNFGPDAPIPTFKISTEEPADITKFLESVTHSIEHGVPVREKQYREVVGLEAPEDADDPILRAKALPASSINFGSFHEPDDDLDEDEKREAEEMESFRFRAERKKKLSRQSAGR